jgi:hypothetical protein
MHGEALRNGQEYTRGKPKAAPDSWSNFRADGPLNASTPVLFQQELCQPKLMQWMRGRTASVRHKRFCAGYDLA